jgi:acyl-coenzyme A thioesterase PaaI-like protein
MRALTHVVMIAHVVVAPGAQGVVYFSHECEGPAGAVHGGAIATALDSLLGIYSMLYVLKHLTIVVDGRPSDSSSCVLHVLC